MVKRELSASQTPTPTPTPPPSSPTPDNDNKFDPRLLAAAAGGGSQTNTPAKRVKLESGKKRPSPTKPQKESKGTKTRWTPEEDSALITLMDDLIKTHLWPAIKASGNTQLIARTSYGCQYHAKLLMKQGKTSKE